MLMPNSNSLSKEKVKPVCISNNHKRRNEAGPQGLKMQGWCIPDSAFC